MFYRVLSFFTIIGVVAAGTTAFAQTEKAEPGNKVEKKMRDRKRTTNPE